MTASAQCCHSGCGRPPKYQVKIASERMLYDACCVHLDDVVRDALHPLGAVTTITVSRMR